MFGRRLASSIKEQVIRRGIRKKKSQMERSLVEYGDYLRM